MRCRLVDSYVSHGGSGQLWDTWICSSAAYWCRLLFTNSTWFKPSTPIVLGTTKIRSSFKCRASAHCYRSLAQVVQIVSLMAHFFRDIDSGSAQVSNQLLRYAGPCTYLSTSLANKIGPWLLAWAKLLNKFLQDLFSLKEAMLNSSIG